MSRLNADIVISLLLIILSAVLFEQTFEYETVPGAIIGAKIWPRVVTIFLGGLAILYFLQSVRNTRAAPATTAAPWSFSSWLTFNQNVIVCFVLYGVFLVLLPWLGMLLAGMLFVFVVMTYLGEKNPRSYLINLAVAVVTISGMWALFTFGLGVILPQGELLPR